jgi:hypothetical protein
MTRRVDAMVYPRRGLSAGTQKVCNVWYPTIVFDNNDGAFCGPHQLDEEEHARGSPLRRGHAQAPKRDLEIGE